MVEFAVVMLGHSHLGPIRDGLSVTGIEAREGPRSQVFVHDVWSKHVDYADSNETEGLVFNRDVLKMIDSVVPPDLERRYVTAFGGNGHILLALTKHPRPFDFVLPENPNLPLDDSAEIIPFNLFMEALKSLMLPYIWQLIALRMAIGQRCYCLETPPPYGDDSYVRSHLGSYIPDPEQIVSRWIRYKVWRSHSKWLRIFCEANDIEFVPVPAQVIDDEGFMVRVGYGPDATHANPWYGQQVLHDLEERLGFVYDGWQVFS